MAAKRKGGKLRIAAGLLLTISMLCGCGSGMGGGGNVVMDHERDWPAGSGELTSRVGNPDATVSSSSLHTGDADPDSWWGRAGYERPTGRWFLHDGDGHLGYGLTTGTRRPGDDFVVELFAHESDFRLDRDIRIRLIERTDEWEPAALIVDATVHVDQVGSREIIYQGTLPDKLNAVYTLSAEIVSPAGETEDTRAALIRVPAPEINASLQLDQEVYSAEDETAVLTVVNDGPTDLSFGVEYRLEKKVDSTWRIVPLERAFIAIGIMLPPGGQYELSVDISPLDSGEYRVVKTVWADGLDLTAEFAAEFAIE